MEDKKQEPAFIGCSIFLLFLGLTGSLVWFIFGGDPLMIGYVVVYLAAFGLVIQVIRLIGIILESVED